MRRCADSESHLIVIRACVLGKVPHVQSDACSPSAERATEPPGRWGQLLFCHVSALQTRLFTPLPARAARSRGCWGRPGETGDAGRCAGRSVNGRRCGPSATDTRNERAPTSGRQGALKVRLLPLCTRGSTRRPAAACASEGFQTPGSARTRVSAKRSARAASATRGGTVLARGAALVWEKGPGALHLLAPRAAPAGQINRSACTPAEPGPVPAARAHAWHASSRREGAAVA